MLCLVFTPLHYKWVQTSHGEDLTTAEVAERLLQENKEREEKKKKENPDKAQKQLEIEDETECQKCKRLWCNYKGKKNDVWLLCDIFDSYTCPKCIPKGTNFDEEFFCSSCTH